MGMYESEFYDSLRDYEKYMEDLEQFAADQQYDMYLTEQKLKKRKQILNNLNEQ